MTVQDPSRRALLRHASLLALARSCSPIALNLAALVPATARAAAGDYRALVYIHFAGGNDAHNMVLATDPTSWSAYQKYRNTTAVDGATSIALDSSTVLAVSHANAADQNTGRSFALHPNLAYLKTLYTAKRAAVVANVGPLITPTSAAQYKAASVPLPLNLFSHNSQSATWQAFSGPGARAGWGGKMGDLLLAQNANAVYSCMSVAGNSVFLAGQNVVQLQVGGTGLAPMNGVARNGGLTTSVFDPYSGDGPDTTVQALTDILTRAGRADVFASDVATINKRSIDAQADLAHKLVPAYNASSAPAGVATPPAGNGLAAQLQFVLRSAASATALGVKRQVFFLQLGGFDFHSDEIARQAALMQTLDDAVRYFDATASGLGLTNNITLMTGSDFGRSFTSNGDGTDHGWGSHHFVVGGAVAGGDVYGRFPTLGVNNEDNVGAALLPNQAVDQYGATLARWMGVSTTALDDVFPNLRNFSSRDLGFMRAG